MGEGAKFSKFSKFSAHVYCGQTAGWIKMSLGTKVDLSPGDCVRWGPALSPQRGQPPPQFLANFYCSQTASCVKMPLGMEVGLSPGDCVRWGPSPLLQKGADCRASPNFRPTSIVAKRLHGSRCHLVLEVSIGLRNIVFDVDPATLRKKGTPTQPNFWPMSIVATVAHLSY